MTFEFHHPRASDVDDLVVTLTISDDAFCDIAVRPA
jgi:hypothetical protein